MARIPGGITRTAAAVALAVALGAGAARIISADTSWLQWGGARRNFMVDATGLADSWPSGGPKQLWRRTLGEGHSAIVVDGDRLYTMHRPGGLLTMVRRSQQETIAAMNASDGKTVWEHTYDNATDGLNLSEGAGPHSTPLIIGNLLYTVSSRTQLFALDKNTGKVVWSHDLVKEYSAPQDGRGYSASPIA
jgi:outer membrane protein assembly factor BamB